MSLPSNLVTITVTGTYLTASGNPVSGEITFTPPAELIDVATAVMCSGAVTATLNSSGIFSVILLCTDNPTLQPVGWTYTVAEGFGARRTFQISLPRALGSTVDITTVMPIPTLPGSPPQITAGQLPDYAVVNYPNAFSETNTFIGPTVFTGEVTVPSPVNATDAVNKAWALANGGSGGSGLDLPAGDLGGTGDDPTVTATHLATPLPTAQGGTGAASLNALLQATNNLSDVPSPTTARTNLGLGSAAQAPTSAFDAAGAASAAQSAAETAATSAIGAETTRAEAAEATKLTASNNLSDLTTPATARTNLGLGTAATAASSTFDAAGAASTAQTNAETFATAALAIETTRAEAAEASKLNAASNLSDVASASTARTNLGLGTAATSATSAFDAAGAAASAQSAAQSFATSAVSTETTRAEAAEATRLASASNLSDLQSSSTARTNLGLGSAATSATSAFDAAGAATAAQTAAQSFATSAVATETTRAEAAEALKLTASNNLSDVGSPATAFGNIKQAASTSVSGVVQFDGTTGDIQPFGTGAAGAVGKAADAGHVHPRQPYQFAVGAYGAKGDGKSVTDGAITSGTNTLVCGTSTPFAPGDVGKALMIKGAGATNPTTLVTTITGYTSASTVTLAINAVTTTTAASVFWGTDDTAAFQSAVNAAVTYAQAHSQYAEIVIPPSTGLYYAIAGALSTANSGNAQITLPVISQYAPKVTLVFVGGQNSSAPRYWNQTLSAFNGPCLVSFGVFATPAAQSTSITNGGNPAVIGGPTGKNGYGTSALLYSNMMASVKGLTILTTHSAAGLTYSALNFHGLACAGLEDVSYGTTGVYLLVQTGGDFTAVSTFSTGLSIGILLPAAGNNDGNQIRNLTCQGGYTFGLYVTEHTDIHGLTMLYCWSGLCIVGAYGDSGAATGALHAMHATQVSVESCSYHLDIIGAGVNGPIFHGTLDTEGALEFHDSNSGVALASARGEIRLAGSTSLVTLTFPTLLRIISDLQPRGPVTAPTFALNTAQINAFWRDATVIATGGTGITSIQISSLAGGPTVPSAMTTIYSQSAGALAAPLTFRVPAGCWWIVNATSGTAPTTTWTLD